jgi:hypothetical protein
LEVGGVLSNCESSGADEKGNKKFFHNWILVAAKIGMLTPFEERVYEIKTFWT